MEGIDWLEHLKRGDIWFKIAALAEKVGEPGSYERTLMRAVRDSVMQDIEAAVRQWELERNKSK